MGQRTYTQDAELIFKDAGVVTATGAATVAGSAATAIREVGPGRVDMNMIVDVANAKLTSGDEHYTLVVQGSNSATFASGIENLASVSFGTATSRQGGAQASLSSGRREVPFTNDDGRGTPYRYIRMLTVVAGTSPSINYSAWGALLLS